MKKLFLLLAAVGMLAVACAPGGWFDNDNNGNPTEQPGDNENGNSGGDNNGDNSSEVRDPNNPLSNLTCAPNEILYTTKYGLIIELGNTQGFGGNLVYNTYEDGVGRLTFGNDVTTIPENAFKDCNSIEYIKFPETLTLIQKDAFDDCTGLKSLTIPPSITYIELGAFDNCTGELIVQSDLDNNIYFPYETGPFAGSRFTKLFVDAKIIYPYTFSGCEYITSVTISDSTQSFAQGAFGYCPNLTTFNSCLASADKRCLLIGEVLLYFAPGGLSEYTIPRDITILMDDAFLGCSGVAVTIPNNITKISTGGWGAFRHFKGELIMNSKALVEANSSILFGDDSQIELTIGDNITKIGDNRFSGCTSLTSVTIGNSVTSIGDEAFRDCENLTSVTIPDKVTSIGVVAFWNCTSLKSVTIPDSITSIGIGAFCECTSLTSVTIGNGVTSIGRLAFHGCSSLKEVYCKPATPPTGDSYMFNNNSSGRKIYVPRSSVSAYKAATYWSDYASSIVGYDF